MNLKKAKYLISAPSLKFCPELNLPEIALLGRSNVGKSTFINTLAQNSKLAKTSNTPGKTRHINLYDIDNSFIIADLPGYGYAKVAKAEQQDWQKNLENYLLKRESLKLLIQFIDARHQLQKNDELMNNWLNFHKLPYIILITKIDLISRNKVNSTYEYYKKIFPNAKNICLFSKTNKIYNQLVIEEISKVI